MSAASVLERGIIWCQEGLCKEAGAAKAALGWRKKRWLPLEKAEGQSKAAVVILTS